MSEPSFSLLKQREILDILIGDTTFAGSDGYKIEMPRLSGPVLVDRSTRFGFVRTYGGAESRWKYMDELLDFAIREQRESELLAFWFDRVNFKDLTSLHDPEKIAVAYQNVVNQVISAINEHLFLSGNRLVRINKRFQVIPSDADPILSVLVVKDIGVEYIRSLPDRCNDDMIAENFDSVITKSRTLIEEVLIFILEKKLIPVTAKGDIKKLYGQFKDCYNMNTQKSFGERVNKLLSGLETILQSIAEMRNMNSDAHGVGQSRITIKKRDAQLVINTAIVFSEYLLETYKQKTQI